VSLQRHTVASSERVILCLSVNIKSEIAPVFLQRFAKPAVPEVLSARCNHG
jgi:hypothetical protein